MKKHLRNMSNMISKLKDAGHTLTDEQQVQVVICSLPNNWENMKMHLTNTNNESIKTLEDVIHHLELKEDHLMASKANADIYMASSGSQNRKWHKRKYQGGHEQEDRENPQGRKRQKAYQLGK